MFPFKLPVPLFGATAFADSASWNAVVPRHH
jgi:hypothetical protein